jgi:four helix bundle protein
MRFHAYDYAVQIIRELAGPARAIAGKDPDLGRQLRKAAQSIALNLAEGRRRAGKDRLHHFRVAAGSADEVLAALDIAEAWGYVTAGATKNIRSLLDSELAMLYRLTH